ncbi:hypothetical protein HK104_007950 [Borealophlyctis nickersoniae]|nr:hypothetical protein HK104_007950 [Borealophlyctis nickersoniae]
MHSKLFGFLSTLVLLSTPLGCVGDVDDPEYPGLLPCSPYPAGFGVYIGATNSHAAFAGPAAPSIDDVIEIADSYNKTTIPSVVAVVDDQFYIGNEALEQARLHPNETVVFSNFKRHLGWDTNGEPKMAEGCSRNGTKKTMSGAELTGKLFDYMLELRGRHPEIPETFPYVGLERYVLQKGFDHWKMQEINPKYWPKFLSLSVTHYVYGYQDGDLEDGQHYVKFHLGGRTMNLVSYCWDGKEEGHVGGIRDPVDLDFGGAALDKRLMEHLLRTFRHQFGDQQLGIMADQSNHLHIGRLENGTTPLPNSTAMDVLRKTAEEVKIALSSNETAHVELLWLHNDQHLIMDISRREFELLIEDDLEYMSTWIDKVLKTGSSLNDNDEDWSESCPRGPVDPQMVGRVYLTGGSTNIPKVVERLQDKFPNAQIPYQRNRESVIARGSARQASFGRHCF